MNTKYMRQVYMGNIGDIKNLEVHFAHMAEKGWMIDKIGAVTHRYRAIEPKKLNFFVDLLPQITAFDYPDGEDAQDYRAICEASGWAFVLASKQIHVFCAEGETPPTPIHTDNTIQAKIYLKASRKYELWTYLFSLLPLWFLSPFGQGVELFLSNMMLFLTVGYLFFFVGYFWTLGFTVRWYLRTKKAAKLGLPMPDVSYRMSRIRGAVFAAGAIIFMVLAVTGVVLDIIGGLSLIFLPLFFLPLLGIVAGLWFRKRVDTKKRTRGANIRLFVIAIAVMELVVIAGMFFTVRNMIINTPRLFDGDIGDRPILRLSDFGIETPPDPEHSSSMIKGSVAVPVNYSFWESSRDGSVNSEVYRSVSLTLSKALYAHFSDEFSERYYSGANHLSPADAAYWGADEGAAVLHDNSVKLLLRRGKTTLRLSIRVSEIPSITETAQPKVLALWERLE